MSIPTQNPCIVCGTLLELRPTGGRESGKPSLMFICPVDGRHFRGFVNDQGFVREVYKLLEEHTPSLEGRSDLDANPSPGNGPRTGLERDSA